MPTFDCPKCGKEVEIEYESLPNNACDTELFECPHCGVNLQVGWEAYVTATLDDPSDAQHRSSAAIVRCNDLLYGNLVNLIGK